MRRFPVRFWVVASLFLALNAGGWFWLRRELRRPRAGHEPVHLVSSLPRQQVDTTDRLSLVFDAPLAPTGQLGQPLDQAPFRTEPVLAGTWVWVQPERLDFVLDKPLPAGRDITVLAAPDIELQTGRVVQVDHEVTFSTRALEVERCSIMCADRTHVTVELLFNQPVSPSALTAALSVLPQQVRGEPTLIPADDPDGPAERLDVSLLVREPSDTHVLRIARPSAPAFTVHLDGQLKGHEGTKPLGDEVVQAVDVPPLAEPKQVGTAQVTPQQMFDIVRAFADAPGFDDQVTVHVTFSRDLRRDQPVPKVTLTPLVEKLSARFGTHPHGEIPTLILEGDFQPGTRYTVAIEPTLVSSDGVTLKSQASTVVEIPEREPQISFDTREGFLSPLGNRQIDLRTVKVKSLRFASARVHANNLVLHLQGAYRHRTSRELAAKTLTLDDSDKVKRRTLELKSLLDQPTGVYQIEARALDESWTADWATVTLTDMGLTAKRERTGLVVWVTSLRTAKPLANVKVSAITYNNQTLGSTVSGPDGLARLALPAEHPDGPPWVVVAEAGDDLSYQRLDQNGWVLDDVDQSGRAIPTSYDVLLYTERGAYRPGDTLHLTGIVRDAAGHVPPAFPLTIGVTRPDGRRVADLPVNVQSDQQGMFHADYPTRPDAQTGPYRFVATLPGSSESLGSTHALVEAFVPVRIDVQAAPAKPLFGPGEAPSVQINARYLFGQPAADLPVKATGTFQRIAFEPTDKENTYHYGLRDPMKAEILEQSATLSAAGQTTLSIPLPPADKPGRWRANLDVTVTEPGGRSVSRTVTFIVDTAGKHVGLRLQGGAVQKVNDLIGVEWVLRSFLGKPTTGELEFTLSRVEYESIVRRRQGQSFWTSRERLLPVSTIVLKGDSSEGTQPITCPVSGNYRLRMFERGSQSATELDFYATANPGEQVSVALARPERIELALDRPQYAPGSTARLVVKSPFAGTLLLTIETDKVIETRLVEMNENSLTVDLPVPANLRGGAFITASIVRAVDPARTSWLPHRAQGLIRLMADHSSGQLPLTLEAPTTARPGSTIQITVALPGETGGPMASSRAPAMVHLWAVDEGILLTTDYRTPDAAKHFFAPRRPGVSTSDVFGDLLPDYARPAGTSRIGGDDDHEVDPLRRGPIAMMKSTPAVLWRTSVPLNDGKLTVDLPLPQFTGELRLMAVAVSGDRYGTAQQAVTVTAPLLVESAWPRFAAPGDAFKVPVKVFGTFQQPTIVDLDVQVSGPLAVALPPGQSTITLTPGEPATVWLDAQATGPGAVSVTVTARNHSCEHGPLTATAEASLPIRYAAPVHTVTTLAKVAAGETYTWEPPQDLAVGQNRVALSISAAPTIQLRPTIEQLLEYPHGCVEQTSSRLYALLLVRELLGDDPTETARVQQADDLIAAGIARLWSMQTRSGGLGYWPGASEPDVWGTAYAAGAIQEAIRQGHPVDSRFADELAKFLSGVLHQRGSQSISDDEQALACRMLAGFQKPDLGWMTRLSERVERLDMEGRADLAQAWLLAGRKDRALSVLPEDTLGQVIAETHAGRLTSSTRQAASLLRTLLDVDPEHAWIPVLAQRVETARRERRGFSTFENAGVLTALARYQRTMPKSDFTGTIEFSAANGATVNEPFTHAKPLTIRKDNVVGVMKISAAGTGTVFITSTATGLLKPELSKPYDHGLFVRRRWLDRKGNILDPQSLRVGDLVTVEVRIANEALPEHPPLPAPVAGAGIPDGQVPVEGEQFEPVVAVPFGRIRHEQGVTPNVAIVDLLPGGLEIENPRLATSAQAGAEGAAGADHVEFLDDRVVLFTSVSSQPRTFRYSLRVTSTGRFALPPIQASCMYNEAISSLGESGSCIVQP